MIGLVALDSILRIRRRSTLNVAFIIASSFMHFDDFSANTSSFRIPAHVIANLERLGQCSVLVGSWSTPYSRATCDAKSTSVYNIDPLIFCLLPAGGSDPERVMARHATSPFCRRTADLAQTSKP